MDVILHLGLPKTATKYLQAIFAGLHETGEIINLASPYEQTINDESLGNKQFYKNFLHSVKFQEDPSLIREQFKEKFKNLENYKKLIMISNENVIQTSTPPISYVISRLAYFFPEAKLLIVIRNQITAISSYYSQAGWEIKNHVLEGKVKYVSFKDFIEFYLKHSYVGYFYLLHYRELFSSILHYFPKENVHILPYELLKNHPDMFFKKLGSILNTNDESIQQSIKTLQKKAYNERPSKRFHFYTFIRQFLPISSIRDSFNIPPKFASAIDEKIRGGKKHEINFNSSQKNKIRDLYALDNAFVEKEFKLSLREFDYPMPDKNY